MKRDLFEAGLNEAAQPRAPCACKGRPHLIACLGRTRGSGSSDNNGTTLALWQSKFWFVSSCNVLRDFTTVWPYSRPRIAVGLSESNLPGPWIACGVSWDTHAHPSRESKSRSNRSDGQSRSGRRGGHSRRHVDTGPNWRGARSV